MVDEQINELFALDETSTKIDTLLRDFINKTSRSRLSMSKADIAVLHSSRGAALELVQDAFGRMIEQAEERRRNLLGFSGVKVISIGEDCFSRTTATHWGLKRSAQLGEKTHPFDLSVHPLKSIIHLIGTDFSGYLDPDNLHYNQDNKIIVNKKVDVTFNHESGEKYAENNFILLRELYRTRINNFNDDIARSDRILFLFHNIRPERTGRDAVFQLERVIASRWPGKQMKFICVNTWQHNAELTRPMPDAASDDGRMLTIDIQYPYGGYVWHVPTHCLSKAGYDFEKTVVKKIKAFMISWYEETAADTQPPYPGRSELASWTPPRPIAPMGAHAGPA